MTTEVEKGIAVVAVTHLIQGSGGSSDRDDTVDVKSRLTKLLQYGPVPAREITEAAN